MNKNVVELRVEFPVLFDPTTGTAGKSEEGFSVLFDKFVDELLELDYLVPAGHIVEVESGYSEGSKND